MSSHSRNKRENKQLMMRIVSIALAALMVLSVVMSYVGQHLHVH